MLLHGVGPAREHDVAAWPAIEIPVGATLECHHGTFGHRHCHRQLVEPPVVGILFRLALEKCLAIIVDMRLGASPELWRRAAGGGGKKRGGWWGG
jgi:hypothetical protein